MSRIVYSAIVFSLLCVICGCQSDTEAEGKVIQAEVSAAAVVQEAEEAKSPYKLVLTSPNPDPSTLPTLSFWLDSEYGTKVLELVSMEFPEVPGSRLDGWCYEAAVDFVDAQALPGGALEIKHRDRNDANVIYITTVTPEPGAVNFEAHAELAADAAPDARLPENLTTLNMCWQVKRSDIFRALRPDYPEFVKRCFIFTEDGMTSLMDTERLPIASRAADHEYNNPPWVQNYVGVWQQVPESTPTMWAPYSPNRYIETIIGCVSHDGKYLTALANDTSTGMAQAWHDCMHNNAQWTPADAPPADQRWRVKVYVMENDCDKLLERVKSDFPNAMKRQLDRVD